MLSSIFYGMSSLILCIMISNATGPSLDYSHLSKPTATSDSILSSSSSRSTFDSIITKAHSTLFYNLELTGITSAKSDILEAVKSYSNWSWRKSSSKRRTRRISRKKSTLKATTTSYYDHQNDQEGGPKRSIYSPPAGYSVQDYEEYQLRHATSFNKSEPDFCGTEKFSNQEHDWKTQTPINIPHKP